MRASWYGQRLTLRWDRYTGQWVLRRGRYRVASNRDWWDLYALVLRIADRERRERARRDYLASAVDRG